MKNYIIVREKDSKKKFVIGFYAENVKKAELMFNDIDLEAGYKYQLYQCKPCKKVEVSE